MRRFVVLGGALALVIFGGVVLLTGSNYTVNVAMPSATNLIEGSTVQINGFDVGTIEEIRLDKAQPVLTLGVDRDHAPLHEGARVHVEWKALLGERIVQITDGPRTNATIPDGGLIKGQMPKPTELDEVLNTLDAPTLKHVSSLVNEVRDTVKGYEGDINASVSSAGPALKAVGGVLDAIGTDGPAIRDLVKQLNQLTGTLAGRQNDVTTIVSELSRLSSSAASRREQLRDALSALPPTLRTAQGTLDRVPPVVDKTVPVLEDLEAGTERLPSVAHNLRGVLSDLRPALRDLRPTVAALDELLDHTPGLLDSATDTIPGVTEALHNLERPVDFLRPYTPEAMGWLSNWGSAFASYDSNGHYARIWVPAGGTTVIPGPGVFPPGLRLSPYPAPGQNGGTPWTDAFGSGVR